MTVTRQLHQDVCDIKGGILADRRAKPHKSKINEIHSSVTPIPLSLPNTLTTHEYAVLTTTSFHEKMSILFIKFDWIVEDIIKFFLILVY